MNFVKFQRKKKNFNNGLIYAEKKIICVSIDVYRLFEGEVFIEFFDV